MLSGTRDEKYLRRAIALAHQSRASGHHPFGCVIVTDDDQILAECESRKERGGDATQHSELTAVKIASGKWTPAVDSQPEISPKFWGRICSAMIANSGICRFARRVSEPWRALIRSNATISRCMHAV